MTIFWICQVSYHIFRNCPLDDPAKIKCSFPLNSIVCDKRYNIGQTNLNSIVCDKRCNIGQMNLESSVCDKMSNIGQTNLNSSVCDKRSNIGQTNLNNIVWLVRDVYIVWLVKRCIYCVIS